MPCKLFTVLMTATLLLASGCRDDSSDGSVDLPEEPEREAPADTAADDAPEEQPMEENDAASGAGIDLTAAIDAARRDLAGRLDTDPDNISVAEARRVTWRSGALGCPEEGTMYTQALVEGAYIRLAADGDEYAYHAGRDGEPFACPAERSEPPAPDEEPAAY